MLIPQKPFYINCLTTYYGGQEQPSISDIVQQCLAIWLASMHLSAMVRMDMPDTRLLTFNGLSKSADSDLCIVRSLPSPGVPTATPPGDTEQLD